MLIHNHHQPIAFDAVHVTSGCMSEIYDEWIMSATNVQETYTRNWCKMSCSRNLHVCWSIWYKFFSGKSFLHEIEHSPIPSQKLSGTWHEPCNVIGRRVVLVQENCDELQSDFSCKFLVQISWACVAGIAHCRLCGQRWRQKFVMN